MANNLDLKELEVLYQIYLDKKSDEINAYLASKVEDYTVQLYLQIMMAWDSYYKSYTPKVYVRTGDTEKGISPEKVKRVGNKFIASVEFDNDYMYHDESAMYGSQKTYGHAYAMIDIGWEDRNLKPQKYRYSYYSGYNMTSKALKTMRAILPDWIEIEIVTRNTNWLGGRATSAYGAMSNKYGKG